MTKGKTAKRGNKKRNNEKLNDKIENNEMPAVHHIIRFFIEFKPSQTYL
jgi:hypothetical protein